ncbi:glycosyltransferase family 1 protein [bacterium]|nr:glycosyltransferase family 1 protein [bacterium]
MKLAIVRQTYTPYGGAERFVERALAGLRAQGADVTVIARQWAGADDGRFLCCDPAYFGRTWRDAGFSRAVQGIIASGRFDLVQSHERIPGCHIFRAGDGVHATWLELRDRARGGLARLATALSPWHRYTLAAEAAMFRHPALRAVICNSRMVRDDIARRFGLGEDKLHVIYNGVDMDYFHPGLGDEHRAAMRRQLNVGLETPLILFVGSGFERKGVPVLIQALPRMARHDAVLVVVGRDKAQASLMKRATGAGLGERVRFIGPQKDVRPFYGAADVFALPTLYDPFPNAALEALACGLPIATSSTCGAAELVRAGLGFPACGTVCDALDAATLARQLDSLIETRASLGDAARHAVAHLSLAAMAESLGQLYESLLKRPV